MLHFSLFRVYIYENTFPAGVVTSSSPVEGTVQERGFCKAGHRCKSLFHRFFSFCHITRKNFLKKFDFRCCTFSIFGSIYMKTLFRRVLLLLQVQLRVRYRKGAFAKPDIVAKASFTDLHFLVMTRNFFVLNTYAFSFRVRLNQYIIFGENSSEVHLCHVVI